MDDAPLSALQYGPREQEPDSYWMRFRPVTRKPESWREELSNAARTIANRANKPIWIAMSGGVDSEITARSFLDHGINFSALTLEHTQGTNRRDVDFARAWCFKRGIPHKILPFDAKQFLTHDVDAYIAADYATTRVYRYLQIRLLEIVQKMGGYAVLGNGKIVFQTKNDEAGAPQAYATFGNSFTVPFDWCKNVGVEHQPYFLFSSPELVLSYLQSPFIKAAIMNPLAFKNPVNNIALRRFVAQTEWPEVKPRAPFLGFERLNKLKIDAEKRMARGFTNKMHAVTISATEMLAQLSG